MIENIVIFMALVLFILTLPLVLVLIILLLEEVKEIPRHVKWVKEKLVKSERYENGRDDRWIQ